MGTISTNLLLDRESIAQHNISIVATKVNNPILTSKVAVTVHVLDVNEFPPEFAVPYETFVCENAKAGQVIQIVSATDQDLPSAGQKFSFKSVAADVRNRNFTVRDFGNNTAGVVANRGGFRRRLQEMYFLPVAIEDEGPPVRSSTGTLTIRVCGCEADGTLLTCSAEAIFLPVGLSTGALIAILLCIIILLVSVSRDRGPVRGPAETEEEGDADDVEGGHPGQRDPLRRRGGGEEDTHAFDMGTLRNPKALKENGFRRDVKPEAPPGPRTTTATVTAATVTAASVAAATAPAAVGSRDNSDIHDYIRQRLQENDGDSSAPPYDSLATYAYEGEGSAAESLSSIESPVADGDEDYDYLTEWGPRFKTLAGIFGEQDPQSNTTTTTDNKL
ncbi:hypothetical protein COCON_G00070080 [Conger conger]|uniref:Cadherin domain-containing protein n=1 Tax=Conger conger TaxID=82655 RepID=A0A9Q1DT83_CONCO|nr:hypothetical protein COCON_G00070080 [Conger conger]